MAFPSSPTNGQVAVQNGISYTYNSTYKSWTRNPATLPTLSVYTGTFTGDGVTTSFTLSLTPVGADFISINIDGVSQLKSAYTLLTNVVTFTGTPDVGAVIEIKSWNSATLGVLTGLTFDSFTGNGVATSYTLSTSPTNKNYTLVTIGGITQEKVNYGVSGTTLTFTTAPPNLAPIEVMTFGPAVNTTMPGGSTTQVQYNNGGVLSGSSSFTFNNSSNTLSVSNMAFSSNLVGANANFTNVTVSSLSTTANLSATNISTTTITTTGNTTIGGNASISGNTTLSGNTTISGTTTLSGNTTIGNATVTGTFTVGGSQLATFGKSIAMTIIFGA